MNEIKVPKIIHANMITTLAWLELAPKLVMKHPDVAPAIANMLKHIAEICLDMAPPEYKEAEPVSIQLNKDMKTVTLNIELNGERQQVLLVREADNESN